MMLSLYYVSLFLFSYITISLYFYGLRESQGKMHFIAFTVHCTFNVNDKWVLQKHPELLNTSVSFNNYRPNLLPHSIIYVTQVHKSATYQNWVVGGGGVIPTVEGVVNHAQVSKFGNVWVYISSSHNSQICRVGWTVSRQRVDSE